MKKRYRDPQPWLDYFAMLHTHEEKGFLQVEGGKHEAYATEPALYVLAGCSFSGREKDTGAGVPRVGAQVGRLVRRLRTYAAWKGQGGTSYGSYPFAVHVVKDTEPHDLLYTIVLETTRKWYRLWMPHDSFEVIKY